MCLYCKDFVAAESNISRLTEGTKVGGEESRTPVGRMVTPPGSDGYGAGWRRARLSNHMAARLIRSSGASLNRDRSKSYF